jgi:hypothetical protein
MAIAQREQRTFGVDAEVDRRSSPYFGAVHVSSERLRHQHIAGFARGGSYSHSSVEGLQRQPGGVVRIERLVDDFARIGINRVHPCPFRQRVLERGRVSGTSQGAEEGHGGGDGPIPGGLDSDQVNRQRVARFGTLNPKGSGLRIDEGVNNRLTGEIGLRSDLAAEGILRE